MNQHVITKEAFGNQIPLLSARYRVIGPKRKTDASPDRVSDQFIFGEIKMADELILSYPTTILPPKKALLPQKEELFHFADGGHRVAPVLDDRPTIVFGIHTCDLHAVILLDHVLSQGLADQHYLARRANTILVSIECLEPCTEHAFCKDMGTWTVPEVFDLHLTDLGDEYIVETGSTKGEMLLQDLTNIRPARDVDHRRQNQVMSAKWPRFSYRLECDTCDLPSLLGISYRSQLWEEIGRRCLACGACTAVCPTCFCFDVVDEVEFDLSQGKRYRIWDSCQFGQFATVAGGHDFRANQATRLRHRFNHKFKYLNETTGMAGCVGCGRCSEACLVNIRLVDVLNDLQRKQTAVANKRREVVR